MMLVLEAVAKDGGIASDVDPARAAAYAAGRCPTQVRERLGRARTHAMRSAALLEGGDGRRAAGAMLAAHVTLLRAAVTPAASEAEHWTKLKALEGAPLSFGTCAHDAHVMRLVNVALATEAELLEIRRPPAPHPLGGDAPRAPGGSVSAPAFDGSDGPSEDELDLYGKLEALGRDRVAILGAMIQSLTDEVELRDRGSLDAAEGAHVTLEDFDLAACAIAVANSVEAEDKVRLLTSSHAYHRTRSALLAAVIQAARDVEEARWGPVASGRA